MVEERRLLVTYQESAEEVSAVNGRVVLVAIWIQHLEVDNSSLVKIVEWE